MSGERVVPQGGMVVEVFVAAAQAIQPLRHQGAHLVDDAIGMRGSCRAAAAASDRPILRSTCRSNISPPSELSAPPS